MDSYFPSSDQLMIQIQRDETSISEDTYVQLLAMYDYFTDHFDELTITGTITRPDSTVDMSTHMNMLNQQFMLLEDLSPLKIKDNQSYHLYTLFSKDPMTHTQLSAIEDYLKSKDIVYAISGNTYIQLKVLDYIVFILTRVPPLALLILLFVFNLQIKSKKGTILSVLPAGMGALWTLGIVGWVGESVSILTVLAPIFAIVIGSADGLHFIAHIQEEQKEHGDTNKAIITTLKMVGLPMIITTVTSMAGFLSLLVMNTDAIKGLAYYASLGILLAGIATWFVLPLILTGGVVLHGKQHKNQQTKKGLKRFWGFPSIAVVVLVLLIFSLGIGQVKQEFNMLTIYRSYTDVAKNNEIISEVNGGTLPVFIYGDLADGFDLKTTTADVINFEEELKNLDGVGKVFSGFDFIEKVGGDINNIPPGIDTSIIGQFMNFGAKKFKVMVFPLNHENITLQQIEEQVEIFNQNHDHYQLQITGSGYMMMELNESMLMNEIASSLLAMGVVFILLLIALRHLKGALVSLVPIVLTLLFLFGFLGLTGISLNVVTCTIFSITIGVGIDYAIHFTSTWRTRVREGLSSEEAAHSAYKYTARPILANAFGLSLGFTALMLSPLQIHMTVSILMWAAMVSSVMFSLVILPSLLRKM